MKSAIIAAVPILAAADTGYGATGYAGASYSGAAGAKATAASASSGAAASGYDNDQWAKQASASDYDSRWGKSYDSVEAKSYDDEQYHRKVRADDDQWATDRDQYSSKEADSKQAAASKVTQAPVKKTVSHVPVKNVHAAHGIHGLHGSSHGAHAAHGLQQKAYGNQAYGYGNQARGYGVQQRGYGGYGQQ